VGGDQGDFELLGELLGGGHLLAGAEDGGVDGFADAFFCDEVERLSGLGLDGLEILGGWHGGGGWCYGEVPGRRSGVGGLPPVFYNYPQAAVGGQL